jgi:hypothetical protein
VSGFANANTVLYCSFCEDFRNEHLMQVEADGNAIAGISAVVQIISVSVVIYIHVIAVVPIACPVFRPRVNQTKPKPAVPEAAMPANKHHGKIVHAEPVILAIVGTETVIRNAVAVVAAALLPGAVIGLPVTRTITLPSGPLLAFLSRAPLLCRPVALLLTLLALLTLLPSGLLLLLSCRVALLWTLLALLTLLPSGLLLLLSCRVALLWTLLALLTLLPSGLLLRFLLLLLRGLSVSFLFLRFPLPCVSRRGDSEKQKRS